MMRLPPGSTLEESQSMYEIGTPPPTPRAVDYGPSKGAGKAMRSRSATPRSNPMPTPQPMVAAPDAQLSAATPAGFSLSDSGGNAAQIWRSIGETVRMAEINTGSSDLPRILQMIQENKIMVQQNYYQTNNTDQNLAAAMARLAELYESEMQQARREAENQWRSAEQNQMYAQHYAQATTMIGTQAIQELQERDYRIFRYEEYATQCESVAHKWEQTSSHVYEQARNAMAENSQYCLHTETKMEQMKTEMEMAGKYIQQQAQASNAMESLRNQLPLAEHNYQLMSSELEECKRGRISDLERHEHEMTALKGELRTHQGQVMQLTRERTPTMEQSTQKTQLDALRLSVKKEVDSAKDMTKQRDDYQIQVVALEIELRETKQLSDQKIATLESAAIVTHVPKSAGDQQLMKMLKEQTMRTAQIMQKMNEWDSKEWTADPPEGEKSGRKSAIDEKKPTIITEVDFVDTKKVETSITAAAKAGEKVLQVISTKGMKVGQRIRIGREIFEEGVIASFGSIHLEQPLRIDHQVGEPVTVTDTATRIPYIPFTHESDDADEATGEEGEVSEASSRGKIGFTKAIKCPKIPKRRHDVVGFHMDLMTKFSKCHADATTRRKYFLMKCSRGMTQRRI